MNPMEPSYGLPSLSGWRKGLSDVMTAAQGGPVSAATYPMSNLSQSTYSGQLPYSAPGFGYGPSLDADGYENKFAIGGSVDLDSLNKMPTYGAEATPMSSPTSFPRFQPGWSDTSIPDDSARGFTERQPWINPPDVYHPVPDISTSSGGIGPYIDKLNRSFASGPNYGVRGTGGGGTTIPWVNPGDIPVVPETGTGTGTSSSGTSGTDLLNLGIGGYSLYKNWDKLKAALDKLTGRDTIKPPSVEEQLKGTEYTGPIEPVVAATGIAGVTAPPTERTASITPEELSTPEEAAQSTYTGDPVSTSITTADLVNSLATPSERGGELVVEEIPQDTPATETAQYATNGTPTDFSGLDAAGAGAAASGISSLLGSAGTRAGGIGLETITGETVKDAFSAATGGAGGIGGAATGAGEAAGSAATGAGGASGTGLAAAASPETWAGFTGTTLPAIGMLASFALDSMKPKETELSEFMKKIPGVWNVSPEEKTAWEHNQSNTSTPNASNTSPEELAALYATAGGDPNEIVNYTSSITNPHVGPYTPDTPNAFEVPDSWQKYVTPDETKGGVYPAATSASETPRETTPEEQQQIDDYYNQLYAGYGYAAGGLASLPEYKAGGLLHGPGDGMSDSIPAVIKGEQPQRAALADGEFVIPADVVSHLGNGSTKAGSARLYEMMDKIRQARTGNPKQGKKIDPHKFLPV